MKDVYGFLEFVVLQKKEGEIWNRAVSLKDGKGCNDLFKFFFSVINIKGENPWLCNLHETEELSVVTHLTCLRIWTS